MTNLPADLLAAAGLCTGKEETRYYLRGVFLDTRGYLVGLDGHRMFVGALVEKPPVDLIIPTDALLRAVKAAGKTGVVTYERAGEHDWLIAGNERLHFVPVDGTFPDWSRAVPSRASLENETPARFNAKYYADLGKAAKILTGDDTAFHLFQKADAPSGVRFGDRDDCFGVIMPIRRNDKIEWRGVTV